MVTTEELCVWCQRLHLLQERPAAASVTFLSRSLGSSTSPVFFGLLLQYPLLIVGVPFILIVTLKAAYDLMLWSLFRRVRLKQETP